MRKLMARATIDHRCSALSFISLFVDYKAIICNYCTNLVLFLLSTDAEDLVVNLNADEVVGENVCVAEANLGRSL